MNASRYVGVDIHKRHVMVAAVNARQDLVLAPQKGTRFSPSRVDDVLQERKQANVQT